MIRVKGKKRQISFYGFMLAISIVVAIIIFSVFSYIIYSSTVDYINKKLKDSHYSNMLQISKNIDIYLNDLSNIADSLSRNKNILSNLRILNTTEEFHTQIESIKSIEIMLEIAQKNTEGVKSLCLLTRKSVLNQGILRVEKNSYEELGKSPVIKRVWANGGKPLLINLQEEAWETEVSEELKRTGLFTEGEKIFISIVNYGDGDQGFLLLKIDEKWMDGLLPDNTSVIVWDGQEPVLKSGGNIPDIKAYHEIIRKIADSLEGVYPVGDRQKTDVFYKRIDYSGWLLWYIPDKSETFQKLAHFTKYIFYAIPASLLISLLISGALLGTILKPFYSIVNATRKFMNGAPVQDSFIEEEKRGASIRERMMYFLTIVVLIPLVIYSLFFYFTSSRFIRDEILLSREASFDRSVENIEVMLSKKIDAVRKLSFDIYFQNALIGENGEVDLPSLRYSVSNYLTLLGEYQNAGIYNEYGECVYSVTGERESQSYSIRSQLPGEEDFNVLWLGTNKSKTGSYITSFIVKITTIGQSGNTKRSYLKTIGYIVLDLYESQLSEFYRDLALLDSAQILILDKQGIVLSSSDKSKISTNQQKLLRDADGANGEMNGQIRLGRSIANTGWSMTGFYDHKAVLQDVNGFFIGKLYILLIVLLVLLIISYEIAYYMTGILNRIVILLKKVKLYNITLEFPQDTFISEISELGSTFNEMVLRMDTLVDDLITSKTLHHRLEQQKKDAEIIALQSQIKPHFLCNVLESVRCLIARNENRDAMEMLKQLSNLFRYGISKQETEITVGQELEYARAYASIMGMRFPGKIIFLWDIDESAKEEGTLKMLLQPLIENAIEHGLIPKKQPGTVTISCKRYADVLCFSVADDGVGMTRDGIRSVEESGESRDGHKIGLSNVKKRLNLCYGSNAVIEFSSERGVGTRVSITISGLNSKNIKP